MGKLANLKVQDSFAAGQGGWRGIDNGKAEEAASIGGLVYDCC
jgi:hypothetical protein